MKQLYIVIITIILLSGCVPYLDDMYSHDKVASFQYICDELEDHYVYLDYKNLDFQEIRSRYAAAIDNSMSDEAFYHQLEGLFQELLDGHCNIFAPFTHSSVAPVFFEDHLDNYDARLIKENYLNDYPIYRNSCSHGLIQRDGKLYGYIYYASFMDSLSAYEMEYILNRFRENNVRGIILDIRNNGGGAISNVFTLASYFGASEDGTETRLFRFWRRDSYDQYIETENYSTSLISQGRSFVSPNSKVYKGPVALLTNRRTYSASSFTATAFKAFDNVKQIGAISGGGMGLPMGGTMPNGWTYRYSGLMAMDARASSYLQTEYNYENGVPPDILVDDDPGTELKDEIIDASIDWIESTEAQAFIDD